MVQTMEWSQTIHGFKWKVCPSAIASSLVPHGNYKQIEPKHVNYNDQLPKTMVVYKHTLSCIRSCDVHIHGIIRVFDDHSWNLSSMFSK